MTYPTDAAPGTGAAAGSWLGPGTDEQVLALSLSQPLARLPDRDRDVLLLVAVGGLSYAEAAFALGIPEGTVGSRLNRARRTIIAALGGAPDPASPTADGFPSTLRRS